VGGLSALCINSWLIVGSYQLHLPTSPAILPPVAIDGCWNSNETAAPTDRGVTLSAVSGSGRNTTLTDEDAVRRRAKRTVNREFFSCFASENPDDT
jgi:hypothetical protein